MTLEDFMSSRTAYADEEIEVIYYWYHHMMHDFLRKRIAFVINNGLYDDFMNYSEILNTDEVCYLPLEASVYVGGEFMGVLQLDNHEAFNKITFSECECG